MELKHFSHNHGLVSHQVPQGSEIDCSTCKSPASGKMYACWQCNYFLHEQCFHAARSVRHPSHPLHPLTLVPFPTYPSGCFVCNTCNHVGDGLSYTCSECEFDIHVHCALNPHVSPPPLPAPNYNSQPQNPIYPPHNAANQNYPLQPQPQTPQTYVPQTPPQQEAAATIIKHFSHPHVLKSTEIEHNTRNTCSACELGIPAGSAYSCTEPYCIFILDKACFHSPHEVRHNSHPLHSLTLLKASPDSPFDCYACWHSGKGLAYTCVTCSFTLHIDCVRWPETVPAGAPHQHALTLYYSASGHEPVSITCAACNEPVDQKAWRYYCRECGVGCHTRCRAKWQNSAPAAGKNEDVRDQLVQMQELQMQMEMTRIHSQMIASIGTSVCNLI